MLRCKTSDTPVHIGKKTDNEGNLVDIDRYQRLVGKMIYLLHIRSDIAFVVNLVSQHVHSPKKIHLEAVYKILR